MTEQPSKHLARIRHEHPLWSVRHVTEGYGFTAHKVTGERIWRQTLTDLESALRAADRPWSKGRGG